MTEQDPSLVNKALSQAAAQHADDAEEQAGDNAVSADAKAIVSALLAIHCDLQLLCNHQYGAAQALMYSVPA